MESDRKTNPQGRDVFILETKNGTIDTEDSCLVTVIFEPQFDGNVTWFLHFNIFQNPDEYILPLEGYGLEPSLKIHELNINFAPTLPYVDNYTKTFTIENTCSFPIEYVFSDFDR